MFQTQPRQHSSMRFWSTRFLVSLLAVTGTVVSSHAASMVINPSDLPSAFALPLSGEIVGDDPVTVPHSAPPLERAPWDRPFPRDIAVDGAEAASPLSDMDNFLTRRASANGIPTAFDTSISTNLTSDSCPKFFQKFLADSTFSNCYAISFLLRNSNSFFATLRNTPATSHVLDLSCAVDADKCSKRMSELASELIKENACGAEYERGNPVVKDAYTDFITYQPIYLATCLKNPTTTDYCFVDAVTNTSNPSDYDVYSVPYGSSLSSAPYPTCNECLQASMEIFGRWARVDGQPLVHSYLPSARGVNSKCGDGFVNANVTVGVEKSVSAAWSPTPNRSVLGTLVALTMSMAVLGLF